MRTLMYIHMYVCNIYTLDFARACHFGMFWQAWKWFARLATAGALIKINPRNRARRGHAAAIRVSNKSLCQARWKKIQNNLHSTLWQLERHILSLSPEIRSLLPAVFWASSHSHTPPTPLSGSMAKGKGILMILINCMFACNYNGNNAITPHVQHWVAINNKAPGQRARPVGRLSFVITPYLHPFLQASPLQSNSSGYCSSCSSCAPSGWHTSDDRIITCRATRPLSSFAFSAPAGSYSWRASTEQCIIPRGTWVRTRGVPCQKYWESFHIY